MDVLRHLMQWYERLKKWAGGGYNLKRKWIDQAEGNSGTTMHPSITAYNSGLGEEDQHKMIIKKKKQKQNAKAQKGVWTCCDVPPRRVNTPQLRCTMYLVTSGLSTPPPVYIIELMHVQTSNKRSKLPSCRSETLSTTKQQ